MTDRGHIEILKTAADPERVADALGLHRGRGRRFFCPVCQPEGGATPDLSVQNKGFVCFKCGIKGDLLKLVEVAGGLDFPAAVAFLERETGIPPEKGKASGGIARPARSWGHSGGVSGSGLGKPTPAPDPAIYEAFLEACRLVEGDVLAWLVGDRGISPDVVEACRLRFCGREYPGIIEDLGKRFGKDVLAVAGLLKTTKAGRPVPSFWHYYAKRTGFLVIPYILDGRPVYLKVRPPVSKEKAESRGLVRFMNSAGLIPCLYNVDALKGKPDKVLICEGESDTWTALSCGFAAVGSPGAKSFKPAWIEGFRGFVDVAGRSTVYLVPDADEAGDQGAKNIADLFLKAGLPVPLKVTLPPGVDLSEYLKEGMTA